MPDLAVIAGQCIGAIVAVPSVVLYTIQCAVLIRDWGKHFNNTFYKLFLLSAFNNLVLNFLCSSMFGMRLNWMPALNQFFLSFPRWLCGLIFAVNYYNLHAENLLTLFMLVQRLTAILRPFDYEQIWRFLFPISAISSFALPLVPIWHLFGVEVQYYSLKNGQMGLDYNHLQNLPSNSQFLFVASTISLLLYSLINLAIFVAFKKRQSSSTTNSSRIEFRLLVYAIAIFIAQSLICVYWIWAYFSRLAVDNNNLAYLWTIIINQYVWINDLRTIVFPSWFLLWASSEMRGKVMEIVAKLMPCSKGTTTSLAQSNDGQHHNQHPGGTTPGGSKILFTRSTPRNA